MQFLIKSISLAAGAILLLTSLASAQGPRAGKKMRMYDPATEITIKGTIEDVKQVTRGRMITGTHLMVKTVEGTKEVLLGPSNFISSKGFSFAKGESVELTGSKVTIGGTDYIIAREIVKDGKTLTLRDKDGLPQWSGAGMRRSTTAK